MEFNFYYGSQADQFSFIRIPKVMLTEELFSGLSIPAKVLYGVLLDRMTLSRKNGWFDEDNRVFIIYQIGEIQEDLGFSKKKAMELLAELEKFGLLEKKRRGHGLPNILYVKSFMTGLDVEKAGDSNLAEGKMNARGPETGTSDPEKAISRSAAEGTSRSAGFGTSRVTDPGLLRVPVSAPLKSKTELNHIDWNDIESDPIISGGYDEMRSDEKQLTEAEAYEQIIRENIGYDDLMIVHQYEREMIEGILALILETVLSERETIIIASNRYPAAIVKAKFLKLTFSHIEYVLFCLKRNTTIDVFASWTQDAERAYNKQSAFNAMWEDYEPGIKVMSFPEVDSEILKRYKKNDRISKQDITSGKEIPGAKLIILDKEGMEIESWVSKEKPHYIEKLPVGDYTLREVTVPDGYLKAEDVKFSVKDTGEIQKVIMKDDYTKVEISKQDITNGKELPGAKLTIFDKDGKEVDSWVSEEKPHYIERLPTGEYTLREVTAPDGYEVAEDVKFKVEKTGEIQHVVMKDAPKKQPETTPASEKTTTPNNPTTPSTETPKKEMPTTPKTGDDRKPLVWLLLFGIGGCMAGAAWYLRKKDNKDQNQE